MQNLEVPLQVVIRTQFKNIQRKDLNLNLNLNQVRMMITLYRFCRKTVATTVTLWVSQPSSRKEMSSWDYEGRKVLGKQRMVIEPLLWSQWHEGRLDWFLNSRVKNRPTIRWELADENKPQHGVSFDNHCLVRKMKDGCTESLVKPQGLGAMITKTSSSALGQSNVHTGRLKSQRMNLGWTW
jgi:hypothetical protein